MMQSEFAQSSSKIIRADFRTNATDRSKKWSPITKTYGTGSGGGGDDMDSDTRIAILENNVTHIDKSLSEIKSSISDIKTIARTNFLWLLGIFIPSILGLYIFIGTSLFNIDSRVDKLSETLVSTQGDVKELKSDVTFIKSTMEKMASDVAKLANDNKERK